jgi:hypothetical protein
MPITCKRRQEKSDEEHTFTSFVYKARWFTLSQTDGQELEPITIPEWDAERAMKALSIERVPFDHTDGNIQGFAKQRQIAINPLAQLPFRKCVEWTGRQSPRLNLKKSQQLVGAGQC